MGIDKKQKGKEKYDIEIIHHNFTENLKALRLFIMNLSPIVKKHDKRVMQGISKTLEEALKVAGVSKNELKTKKKGEIKLKLTKMTEKQRSQFIDQLTDLLRSNLPILTSLQTQLLYKSSFVMLISYFDFLISDLIHYFYQSYPEALSDKELSITFKELKLYDTLTGVMDYIINKEVDKVLYTNLEDQKKCFKNYLKIDVKENIIHWNKINEAIERRNIIVHNNSEVSRRYLKNVDLSVIPEKKRDLSEGKEITVNEKYFITVLDEIFIAGVILIQCCWRKWKKNDVDMADSLLIEDIYDALSKEKWAVAERMGSFSKECKVKDQSSRLILDVNYCQSLKWQGKKNELEEELKKFDVSALSPKFALALYALRSDRYSFYRNIENAITVDKLAEKDFMEWPLFRELREDPNYEQIIKMAFASVSQKGKKIDSSNSH